MPEENLRYGVHWRGNANIDIDKDDYMYEYDYENRITKVLKAGPTTVAEFAYDALGRRIKKTDSVASQSTVYYYNDKWQVLCEYGGRNWATMLQWFAYGNGIYPWGIDEPLMKGKQNDETPESVYLHLYVQDHLYSTVALVQRNGVSVLERYEYDAYGNCQILSPTYQARATSSYNNPYFFTGRTLDTLDNGNLKLQDNRNRYYDQYTGRFFTHDPLGYVDGVNLYEYGRGDPLTNIDIYGLTACRAECENRLTPEEYPSDRALREMPGGRERRPRWVGWTNRASYTVALWPRVVSSSGGSCWKLVIDRCRCIVSGHWKVPNPDAPSGPLSHWRDSEGNGPKEHELKHFNIINDIWKIVAAQASALTKLPCMVETKARCYEDAFTLFLQAAKYLGDYKNYEFDLRVYPSSDSSRRRDIRDRETPRAPREMTELDWIERMRDVAQRTFAEKIVQADLKARACEGM